MRDILVMSIVLVGAVAALRRPWIGVMLWTWVSLMNPHRATWGFAYDMPVAAIAAGSTLIGLLITRDRESPFKGPPVTWLVVFIVWITLSWLAGLDPAGDYGQWNKVMKIYLMTLVALALLRSKTHIFAFVWVIVISLGFLGAKGGAFTLVTAGSYRVWGPAETFIAENNAFAVAIVMTIPLVRFLQLQLESRWGRRAMTALMILLAASALGSQSRGALLAVVAMSMLLWWRLGRRRLLGLMVMAVVGAALIAFMPETWEARMSTINTYEEDQSAMMRIAAWWVAWGIGFDYPLGVGFLAARPELFMKYSPYVHIAGDRTPVAHSIYFQTLGHHGFVGLGIFLAMWISSWRVASAIRRQARNHSQAGWCHDLASMSQVSFVGYFVGGAFLDLAYFDLPYNLLVILVLTRAWLQRQGWKTEPAAAPGRWRVPGVNRAQDQVAA
ncbi:MAG: putative O-glycosylation ligase, exosortase A system-associated [Burkholderiales bacterium]|nr:putative O-glycosylation ligase, exosortase A system-associated [Burkholderiales bacterium]